MTPQGCGHQASVSPDRMGAALSPEMPMCEISFAQKTCQNPAAAPRPDAEKDPGDRYGVAVQWLAHQARGSVSSAK